MGFVVFYYFRKENGTTFGFVSLANKCVCDLCKDSGNAHGMEFADVPTANDVKIAWETIHIDYTVLNSNIHGFNGDMKKIMCKPKATNDGTKLLGTLT